MSALLYVLVIADGLILAISYVQFTEPWANDACYHLMPLCGYPNAFIILAAVLIGLRFALRA